MNFSVWACFLCGFIVRFVNFGKAPLWIDEYGTWWAIAGRDITEVADRTLAVQGQSPFYYSLTYFSSQIFENISHGLRFPSLLAGILIVPLGYFLARRLHQSEAIATSVAWLLAANDYLIFQSQNARPYSLALFFGLLASYIFVCSLASNKVFLHLLCAITNVATFYSHYVFCGFWMAQLFYLLVSKTMTKKARIASALCSGLGMLFCLPTLPHLFALANRKEELYWVDDNAPALYVLWGALKRYFGVIPMIVLIGAVVLLHLVLRKKKVAPIKYKPSLFIICLLVVPLGLFFIVEVSTDVSLVHERYCLSLLIPMVFVLGAFAGSTLRLVRIGWLPMAFWLLTTFWVNMLPGLQSNRTFTRHMQQYWGEAVAQLNSMHEDGQWIFCSTGFVENNFLSLSDKKTPRHDFVLWPVAGHLVSAKQRLLVPLPGSQAVREDNNNLHALRDMLQHKINSHFWIVGYNEGVDTVRSLLFKKKRLKILGDGHYGVIRLTLVKVE